MRPNEVIYCENGNYVIGRRRLHEDRLPYGDLTFTEVLAKSSNIGTAKVAQRLTSASFIDAIHRFGFGRASGRYFAKFLSWITLLVGFFMAGFTRRKQALHDIVAKTLVISRG